jgi:rRNA methylases
VNRQPFFILDNKLRINNCKYRNNRVLLPNKTKQLMALSKNRIKYIRSLELKKNRKADKVFLAEGPKLVGDLLGHFRCRFLIATAEWLSAHRQLPVEDITEVSEKELSCASLLKTPQQVLAVFEQPDEVMDASVVAHSLCLALDDVQDPGNLGTIIRLADWFGIEHIFCSPNTVDAYNPKTITGHYGGHSTGETALYFPARADWLFERHTGIRHFSWTEKYVHATYSAHGLIVMGMRARHME